MPPHHALELRFIRNANATSGRTDDVLRVSKLGENSVRAIYTEMSGDDRMVDSMVLTYQQFLVYIYRLFFMLGIDDDPFESVQLFVPCYPTVLLKVSTLHKNITQIMELLASVCNTWPTIGRTIDQEANRQSQPTVTGGAGGASATATPPVNPRTGGVGSVDIDTGVPSTMNSASASYVGLPSILTALLAPSPSLTASFPMMNQAALTAALAAATTDAPAVTPPEQ